MLLINKLGKNMWEHHKTLILSIFFSIMLLFSFFLLQLNNSLLLNLDIKWLVFSGIPVLIALFIDGYIKSLKGFGVEVEANLNNAIVKNYNLVQLEADEVPGVYKGDINEISRLNKEEYRKIKRLIFIFGKQNFYNAEVVVEYIKRLPNLEYIEIVDSKRKFKYLLKIDVFEIDNRNLVYQKINKFIEALENRKIHLVYSGQYESKAVKSDESIFQVYQVLKISYLRVKPIINDSGKMIGLVDYNKLAIQIADEIVALKQKENPKRT